MNHNAECRKLVNAVRGTLSALDGLLAESPDFPADVLTGIGGALESIERHLGQVVDSVSRDYDPQAKPEHGPESVSCEGVA